MFPTGAGAPRRAALLLLALAACEEAEGVDVQPLPPLQRPSPEARAGLPEVAGSWRFAGWELPVRDTATAGEGMLPPGAVVVRAQRLDSVAGDYLREGQRFPFVGEVRRDRTFSVVAFGPDGQGSFIAGHVVRDTLWIELTSLSAAQTWSTGTRAALVRTPVRQPFVRYRGGFVPVDHDSIRADSIRTDSLRRVDSLRLADSVPAAVPGQVPAVGPPAAAPPGAGVPKAQPRQPPAKERPRRTQEAERRRDSIARQLPRDTLDLDEAEEEEESPRRPPAKGRERERRGEESPTKPDTTRRPEPVLIP